MSDDASTQPAPSEPRGVRDVIAHAAVVATAWMLGQLGTQVLVGLTLTSLSWREFFGLSSGGVVHLLRWSCVMGVAAAVAAHRRPGCARAHAAFECAALALIAWNVAIGLWLGSEVSDGITGFSLGASASSIGPDQALEWYVGFVRSPFTYVRIAGLGLGLYLAGSRRGTRWEGLALMGPTVLGGGLLPFGLISVPIVAIALPLLTRVVDRLRASRDG